MDFLFVLPAFPLKCGLINKKRKRKEMVKLSFSLRINSCLSQVWEYYSSFQNIVEWDPNTTYCKALKSTPEKIGSQFLLKSTFNGNESTLIYTLNALESSQKRCKIALMGLNDNVECYDEITFLSEGNETLMEYRADISLRGVKFLLTPFIIGSLKKLEKDCREGVIQKNMEKWGTAN